MNQFPETSEYMAIRWPKWQSVTELFQSRAPGQVEILPFETSVHHPEFPWFDKTRSKQYLGGSNPLHVTARHLCIELPQCHPDFVVAYKLYAFAKEKQLEMFSSAVLSPVFKQHGTALYEWWPRNSKYVMPPTHSTTYLHIQSEYEQAKEWAKIVTTAASDWNTIHEEWAVLRIPRLMDYDSDEHKAYRDLCKREHEASERREYERLKAKFDGDEQS